MNPNQHQSDMASALAALEPSNGREDEDIAQWLTQVQMIATMANLDEQKTLKLIILKLKNVAQQWAANSMQADPNIDLKKFANLIKQWFFDEREKQHLLNKFLETKTVKNRAELKAFLDTANKIFEKNGIESKSLM